MGKSYTDLIVWKKSILLVLRIYRLTAGFPADELYGLRSQMRRAAVSIASNIAEGQSRYSHKDFQRFLANSRGSLSELETQLVISRELAYVSKQIAGEVPQSCNEIGRMLNGLYASLESFPAEHVES